VDSRISARAQKITSSAIREILKVTERPEVISFAGGLPSPATFPVERIRAVCSEILATDPASALQYGPTEGYMPLREWVAARCTRNGARVSPAQVMITTGSQQALDLIAKALVERDRNLLVETPTYLGALQAFSLSEPAFVSVPCDEAGPLPAELAVRARTPASGLYLLPNFQNPSGRRIPEARRRAIVDVCAQADLLLFEDDPYGELAYSGETLPTLLSMNEKGVIYTGSFSKLLSPGMRVGYVIAPEPIFRKLVQVKQAADLHTPSFTQRIVHEVVKDGFLDTHIPNIRALYAGQCRVMLDALAAHFPKSARWNVPEGGMFIWVTLPPSINCAVLLEKAVARNVAFVPGAPFFTGAPQDNTLRLSFVTVPPDKIWSGIKTLGELIAEEVGTGSAVTPAL
jgi:2-aminoadipate transaminase